MKKRQRTSPSIPTTWRALVLDAWNMRQAIERRLLLLDIDRIRLERMRDDLDKEFAGQPIPHEEEQ